MLFKSVAALLLILAVTARVFPPPLQEQYSEGTLVLGDPCNLFHLPSDNSLISEGYYFNKILKRLNSNLACTQPEVFLENKHVKLSTSPKETLKPESYEITINEQGIQIAYGDYAGYVYALESLSQIIKDGQVPYVYINDQPVVSYRGIMIDSSRHFLSVDSIIKLITAMPLSKLNVLHWHLVDDESFPVELSSHPELSQGGKYSNKETYSLSDMQRVIAAGQLNAVQIVPEIDTPAHVRSWGESASWKAKNITIKCNGGTGYNGQFDLSKYQTYILAQDVVREVNSIFSTSPYIHLGGDQVSSSCWNLRPQIQDFMKTKGIANYGQLQMYWRQQVGAVLPVSRRVIYWRNDGAGVTITDNDILHYWGAQADVAKYVGTSNTSIILSPSDILYISKGQGNLWLNGTQGVYSVWRNIYENFTVFPAGVDPARILGAQVCLWGEVSNQDTLENNIWMRASAFAARVWSQQILQTYEIVTSLVQIQHTLYGMDVYASPITSEFCENKPIICWPPAKQEQKAKKPNVVQL